MLQNVNKTMFTVLELNQRKILVVVIKFVYEVAGFEQPLMACCGVGGPPLNYDSRVACGQTKVLNGTTVTAKGCSNSSAYINWDGIHYTEAANQYVVAQILTGKYSDPPLADRKKMAFPIPLNF